MTGRRTLSNASLAPWQYLSIEEQRFRRIVNRFREGLVFEADKLLCHSTLGSRIIKKKKREKTVFERLVGAMAVHPT